MPNNKKKTPAKFSSGATTMPMTPQIELNSSKPVATKRRQKRVMENASAESSGGATTVPMTPHEELEPTGSNPFGVGHKRGRTQDSVYTRFLHNTASSAGKSGAGSNRGSKD